LPLSAGDFVIYKARPDWGLGEVRWVAPGGLLTANFPEACPAYRGEFGEDSVRVLVCGSRDWEDFRVIQNRLRDLADSIGQRWLYEKQILMHGDAAGADTIAARAARMMGFDIEAYPANWKRHGRAAGPIRNRVMLDREPDVVLAFQRNGSRGTQDTINEARKRGIPVEVHTS
jgi:phage FluMu gp28-like protein